MPPVPETDDAALPGATSPSPESRRGLPRPSPDHRRKRLRRLLSGLLHTGLFAVLSVVLWWGFAWLLQGQPWIENELMWSVFSLFPAAVTATAFLLYVGQMKPFSAIGLAPNREGLRLLGFGFAAGCGLAVSIVSIQWAVGWVVIERFAAEADPGGFTSTLLWTPPWWTGILVLGVGAAGEELLFRGYGLQQFMRATNPWVAVVGSSVAFGVMHGGNPDASQLGMVNTVLFGILFGFALVRHRSLWLPYGIHFGWNFTLAAIGANLSGLKIRLAGLALVPAGPELWSGAHYGPEASLLTTAAVVVAAVMIWKAPGPRESGPRLWDD